MGSRCSFVTIFCICAILVLGYGSCGNAQDAPTPTPTPTESSSSGPGSAWYPDTSTSTSTPTDSNISTTPPPSTSSSSASTSTSTPTSTSASTGSWFPWFPTTTTPVTTDYPTRPPTRPPTPPSDPYPYPTSRPTDAPTPSPSPYPYPYPDPIYPYPYPYPSYPTGTAYPTDLPDHGTYWPWDTPRGVLPTVQPASSSSLNPDYDSRSYYVVWAVSANDSAIANSTVPSTSSSSSLISLTVRESGDGIYFCARYSSWSGTRSFSLTGYNRAYYSNGVLEQSVRIDSIGFSRLLMQFSYLDSYNRIPKSGSNTATATWSSSSYYITARSRMGEFRMVNVRSGWYSDAADMYRACINERGKDGKLYWETVKMIANGQVQLQTSGSRGSALEHIGAFQWLESRFPSSSSSSSSYSDSYLLISWLSLSGIRLSRYHHYSWYDSTNANAAYDWNSWYNQMYPSTNNYYNYYNYGSNKPVIILYRNGAVVRSTYTNYNDFITLQQDYYSIVHSTTSAPTRSPYDPYPYPYPYPTPSPRYPYPSNSYPSFIFTRNWNDLSNAQRAFIIAYPIAIIGTGIILILITTCCIKSRNRRATSGAAAAAVAAPGGAPVTSIVSPTAAATSLSHRFHNLSTVGILLSLLSLVFLVVALIVNRFSFATFGGTYTWASYGPFSTVQTSPWWGWLNMYWTGQVLGPTTAALIIFNILLQIANFIQLTNIKRSHNATTLALARASHPAMLTCACFIVSFTAVFVWFPIHVRLLDPALARMVIDNFNNSKSYYTYTPSFRVQMGASAILLIVATGVQLLAMIPMCRLLHLARQAQAQGQGQGQTQVPSMLLSVATVDYTRGGDQQSTSTSTRAQQAEQDGLQLVQIGSQYYYRAGPAPMATPYVYGVPTSGPVSYAPPVASAPPATASTYYPGYVPPSFQTLAAPIPTTSIAVPLPPTAASNSVPAPAPSVYPALPVEVPESGPNTRYQRLL